MEPGRLIFIGLDGVGLDLAQSLALRGVMPNLAGLMARGAAWPTASPLPDVSPVCWTTMFSGQEPGEHGIYGFAHHRPGAYAMAPTDSTMVRSPRLWDLLSAQGRRSAILGLPLTFPASDINGVMISGFVCPDLAQGVHPPGLLASLEAAGYRAEAELDRGRDDVAGLLADISAALAVRLQYFEQILKQEPWDLYAAVITDTDRVNHFAWPALWDDGHPLARAALEIYRLADGFIGRVLEHRAADIASGKASLLIAADHSFGPIRSEVYLNPWLVSQGLLQIQGEPPNETILPRTAAIALDPGRIHLHWAGRFPGGWVHPGPEAQALLERISEGLLALRFRRVEQGSDRISVVEEAPIAAVHRGKDLYHGPQAETAPDLVAVAAPGYSLRAGLDRPGVFGVSHLSGTHRPTGALACAWPAPPDRPKSVAGLGGLMADMLGLDREFAPTALVGLH